MESKAKALGHPIHQMLIPFPLGLLPTAVIFDVIYLVSQNEVFAVVSFWMIAAGTIGALVAAVFGVVDFLAIPSGTRAKRVGLWHGVGNVVMVAFFALSWIVRRQAPETPEISAIMLGFVGLILSVITGWLGGELVDRLGVGVDDGAHLNAPSSLSRRAAHESESGRS
jgi:uncharacterized membrane protein